MIKSLMKIFLTKEKLIDLMTYRLRTNETIENVTSDIEKICTDNSFSLLHSYIYHEVVKSKGFPIERKVYVYEVCVAKVAALVLTKEPHLTPFMPCRIAIYEENNEVIISTQNMEIFIDTFDSNSELYKETKELFEKLKFLMSQIQNKKES